MYVKKFSEFINESFGKAKVDELYKMSQETGQDFQDIMREYLENNLNVEEFLNYFSSSLLEELTEKYEEYTDYEEPYKDEDGVTTGGAYYKGGMDSFELSFEDDETYGEFGIVFFYDEGNNDNFHISAFDDELDITNTKLGQSMIETFNKLSEVAKDAAIGNKEVDVMDYKDLQASYKALAQSNGWAY